MKTAQGLKPIRIRRNKILSGCCLICKHLKTKWVSNPYDVRIHMWDDMRVYFTEGLAKKIERNNGMQVYFCAKRPDPDVKIYINFNSLKNKVCKDFEPAFKSSKNQKGEN